jgi:translocation protein SEC63
MKLGVALPSFILDKKNHIPILVIFLLFVVVLIPLGFSFWYNNSKQYDEIGLRIDSSRMYYELLNENVLHKHMPYILGVSEEFTVIDLKQEEFEELNKIYKSNLEFLPKPNQPFCQYEHLSHPNKKAICLLYSYLKKDKISPELQKDLSILLRSSPQIMEVFIYSSRKCLILCGEFILTF